MRGHERLPPAALSSAFVGGTVSDGGGMMGGGMMGGGMMGMMLGTGAKLDIKKMPKGVSMTITSDDAKVVARVQKMAEAMRLMHEAMEQ